MCIYVYIWSSIRQKTHLFALFFLTFDIAIAIEDGLQGLRVLS